MINERAISTYELLQKKFKTMNLSGSFLDLIGTPERSGSWIIYGNTGNGKTRLTLQLARALCSYGKVAYNTIEEGVKLTFQKAVLESNMMSVGNRFLILNKETVEQLTLRLSKRKSPDIIIIDSVQYLRLEKDSQRVLNKHEYKDLVDAFPKKLFIFISHAEGKKPLGSLAQAIEYDADVKIRVEGYKAFCVSRYGGGIPYTIWGKGAGEYWDN